MEVLNWIDQHIKILTFNYSTLRKCIARHATGTAANSNVVVHIALCVCSAHALTGIHTFES